MSPLLITHAHKLEDNLISKYAVFHKALVSTSIIKISFSSGSGGDGETGIIFNPHGVNFSIWSTISYSYKVEGNQLHLVYTSSQYRISTSQLKIMN